MNSGNCPREYQIVAAAPYGRWSAELRAHLVQCESCAEAALVAEFLHDDLRTSAFPALPSAGQVWWRAQIQARRADAERALQPVRVVQKVSAACGLAAALLLLLHYAPQLELWLNGLPAGDLSLEEPLVTIFLISAVAFVAAVSAGLGFIRHSSK